MQIHFHMGREYSSSTKKGFDGCVSSGDDTEWGTFIATRGSWGRVSPNYMR